MPKTHYSPCLFVMHCSVEVGIRKWSRRKREIAAVARSRTGVWGLLQLLFLLLLQEGDDELHRLWGLLLEKLLCNLVEQRRDTCGR